jgi:hypothetical protein
MLNSDKSELDRILQRLNDAELMMEQNSQELRIRDIDM